MSQEFALEFDRVTCRYGAQEALDDVSIQIRPGEFVALVGPNSSGKSTFLNAASGVKKPDAGHVFLKARPLADWSAYARARALAMVSSEEYFAFPFTAREVVAMGRTPFMGWLGRQSVHDTQVVDQAMMATDVQPLADRVVSELSSGERQRVLLARALAQEPQILLLDEPTAHLDIGHEWELFELLGRLHNARPLTVICALHDMALAARYATRVVVMKQGKIIGDGLPNEVLNQTILSFAFGVPLSVARVGDPEALVLTPSKKGNDS